MNPPTAREREVYDTTVTLGSQTKAAVALNLSPGAVASAIEKFRRKTGAPHPTPDRMLGSGAREHSLSIRDVAALLPARIAGLERQLDAIVEHLDVLAAELKATRQMVYDFSQRQPVILEVRPSNKRKADGGQNSRSEVASVRRLVG